MLTDDVVDTHPSSDHPQHGNDGESKTPDAGLAIHLVRLDRDAVVYLRAHGDHPHPCVSVPTVAAGTVVDLGPCGCRMFSSVDDPGSLASSTLGEPRMLCRRR